MQCTLSESHFKSMGTQRCDCADVQELVSSVCFFWICNNSGTLPKNPAV